MDVEFENEDLDLLAYDPTYRGKWTWDMKEKYQEVIIKLKAISRRESLFLMTGLRFKGLSGKRKGQHKKKYKKEYSVRLDGKNRVVLTFIGPIDTEKIRIIDVGDYH